MHVMHCFAHRQQISDTDTDTDTIMCASSGASRLHFSCNTVFTLCRSVFTVRLFVFSDQHPDKANYNGT